MFAKNLALYLHQELGEPGKFDETQVRFEHLRGYSRLPRGRENAGVRLSNDHIANAILGFTPPLPGWAGHVALVLGELRPVGGKRASFQGAESLIQLISKLLESEVACKSIIYLALSIARKSGGDDYSAKLLFERDGARHTTSFVSKMASSLMGEGREEKYDHDRPLSSSTKQLVLGSEFFRGVQKAVALSRHFNRPFETDWREYENEEERQNFHKRLGARNSSRFLNIGVDTQVTWPKEPTRVRFDNHYLILFPKTAENSHSISIDLHHEKLSADEARTLMNRFLSVLSWCDDQHAILRDGWSGNPVPVPVPRHDLAFATTTHWIFDRSVPIDEDLRQRLAYYREGLNAREASISSFEVLSFFKVFESRKKSKRGEINATKLWIKKEFDELCQFVPTEEMAKFNLDRGSKSVEDYIFENNRVATAHASEAFPSDADSSPEVRRLYTSANIMRALARHFVRKVFNFSDSYLSDQTLVN